MRRAAKLHVMDPRAVPTVLKLWLRSLKLEDMGSRPHTLEVATGLKMEDWDQQTRTLQIPSKAVDLMWHRIPMPRAMRTTWIRKVI